MENEFFVILNLPNGNYTSLIAGEDDLTKFATKKEAKEAAEKSILEIHFGFEIFEI